MNEQLEKNQERENLKIQITALVESCYARFDFLHNEPLEFLVKKALDAYLDSGLTIEEINDKIMQEVQKRFKSYDSFYNPEKIQKNHEVIYTKLVQLVDLLDEYDIDYQLAGALCGYLKYGEESTRCHEDIDLHVNEKDMNKFHVVCSMLGLHFADNRLHSPRVLKNEIPSGEHEVIATMDDSDFHVGAFCFERLADGTIISKGYYHDDLGRNCAREEIISSQLAQEIFGSDYAEYEGRRICITSPEYIYLLKQYTHSEKDSHDIEFLESRIDPEKLQRIKSLKDSDKVIQHVFVTDVPPVEEVEKTDSNQEELDGMFEDSSLEYSQEQEKAKQFSKKKPTNDANQNGFVTFILIIAVLLIAAGIGAFLYFNFR